MAKAIPDELSGVLDGDGQSMGSGIVRNAGIRSARSSWSTAEHSTTTADTLSLGHFHAGDCIRGFDIIASTDMSTASIAIGTADDPDMFSAAAALPAATRQYRRVAKSAAGFAPLEDRAELIVTISGVAIPAGDLIIDTEFTRR